MISETHGDPRLDKVERKAHSRLHLNPELKRRYRVVCGLPPYLPPPTHPSHKT